MPGHDRPDEPLVAADAEHDDDAAPDQQPVAGREAGRLGILDVVDQRAVRRAEILDDRAAGVGADPGVTARDELVGEAEVRGRVAADHEHVVERDARPGARALHDLEPQHRHARERTQRPRGPRGRASASGEVRDERCRRREDRRERDDRRAELAARGAPAPRGCGGREGAEWLRDRRGGGWGGGRLAPRGAASARRGPQGRAASAGPPPRVGAERASRASPSAPGPARAPASSPPAAAPGPDRAPASSPPPGPARWWGRAGRAAGAGSCGRGRRADRASRQAASRRGRASARLRSRRRTSSDPAGSSRHRAARLRPRCAGRPRTCRSSSPDPRSRRRRRLRRGSPRGDARSPRRRA